MKGHTDPVLTQLLHPHHIGAERFVEPGHFEEEDPDRNAINQTIRARDDELTSWQAGHHFRLLHEERDVSCLPNTDQAACSCTAPDDCPVHG